MAEKEGSLILPYFFKLQPEEEAAIAYSSAALSSSSIIGLGVNVGLSIFLGASLEAMWNLINAVQLLNLLPLVAVPIPDHMLEMYRLLSFVNGDLDILEELYALYLLEPLRLST